MTDDGHNKLSADEWMLTEESSTDFNNLFQLRKLATDTEKIISWPVTELEALLKFKLGRVIITSVHSN